MDIADHADRLIAHNNADALRRLRRAQQRPGCAECEDCGDAIPQARRAANPSARRCIDCQIDYEYKQG